MDFKLEALMNVSLAQRFNSFYATGLFLPPENIRKPMIFLCFQGVLKETGDIKWVKWC